MTLIQGIPDLGPGLRLHLNENTGGCSPKVVEAVRAFDARALATYPDYRAAVVETAAFLGVDPEWVVLTNGLDEGVLLTAIGYLGPRTPAALVESGASFVALGGQPDVVMAAPAFEPYITTAKAMGARVVLVPPDPDYAFPVERLLAAITPNTRLVYINNPNNPTGQPVAQDAIHRIAREAGHALVFVDEAYHDFMGENFLSEARALSQRLDWADVFQGAWPGRDPRRRHDRATSHPRADSLRDADLQPQRRRSPGTACRADRSRVRAVVSRAGRGIEGVVVRGARARRPALLEERGQLRPGRRRRECGAPGGGDDRPRRARPRSLEGSVLPQPLPHHRGGRRAHPQGSGRAGGPVRKP